MKTNTSKTFLATAATLMMLTVLSLLLAPLVQAQDVIPDTTGQVAAADTQPPSDVENVNAVAGNGEVSLTWNVAMDNTAIKGYKIYYGTKPVVADGDNYDLGPVDAGNKITYTLQGLTNGTTYYFAVTAYDDAANESENYSAEVSATPLSQSSDSEAPKVLKAEATDKQTVKVTFSEAVTLPTMAAENAFLIKNDSTQINLEVRHAIKDPSDSAMKTIILTTAPQEAKINYILTAGIQVKDVAGNPIESGTSDTAVFPGSELAFSAPETPVTQESQQTQALADTAGPELVAVTAPDSTHIEVTFNEAVVLSPTPVDNFVITEEEVVENSLNVLMAKLGADGKSVTLTTDAQKPLNYNLIVVDVKDKADNLISVDNNATVFFGGLAGEATQEPATQETVEPEDTTPGEDTTPPEDPIEFSASKLGAKVVHLIWNASLDSAGDLMNYVLYQGNDGETFGPGLALDPTSESFDAGNLEPGFKYFFKLTARDAEGNESEGIVTSFTLPATGPELGFLLLGSLGLGKWLKRKKK